MRKYIFLISSLFLTEVSAEIKTYQSTDNSGNNKYERIGIIEKYLIDLSQSLKVMEAKLEASSLKVKTLDDVVSGIKEKDLKGVQGQLTEKTAELEKMKMDLEDLKRALKPLEK